MARPTTTTREANLEAWRRLRLRPHVVRDVAAVETTAQILGVEVAAPVLVAPTAMHHLVSPDAERSAARAAAAAGTVMVVSMASSIPLGEIAAAAPDAPRFAQMYVLRDRGRTRAMAEAARERRRVRAIVASVDGAAVPYAPARGALPANVGSLVDDFDASVTLEDVANLAEWSGLPLVVKGVLRGDDARRASTPARQAVYVSNHGGRIVDGCIDTATALAEVVDAVAGRAEVYVDGGVRSGVDVLRALALGATAVLLGRPVLWGLAVGGEAGAREVLDTFRAELARTMAFCGARTIADLRPNLVAS